MIQQLFTMKLYDEEDAEAKSYDETNIHEKKQAVKRKISVIEFHFY